MNTKPRLNEELLKRVPLFSAIYPLIEIVAEVNHRTLEEIYLSKLFMLCNGDNKKWAHKIAIFALCS